MVNLSRNYSNITLREHVFLQHVSQDLSSISLHVMLILVYRSGRSLITLSNLFFRGMGNVWRLDESRKSSASRGYRFHWTPSLRVVTAREFLES